MPSKQTKPVRVWVAVDEDGPIPAYCGLRKGTVEWDLQCGYPDWKSHGITIGRGTLTLDQPKRRRT